MLWHLLCFVFVFSEFCSFYKFKIRIFRVNIFLSVCVCVYVVYVWLSVMFFLI